MRTMPVLFRLTIALVITLSVTSCDCLVSHEGFVRDDLTGEPISGASVSFNKRKFVTDSLGFFDIHYIAGMCDDCNYTVEKTNYRTVQLSVEYNRGEIIYRISEKDNDDNAHGTANFQVRNDTITFYLKKD